MTRSTKQRTNGESQRPLTHQEDPILSFREAGRRIGRSGQTIRRWADEGLIKVERIPGEKPWDLGIRESEVNRWLGGCHSQYKEAE